MKRLLYTVPLATMLLSNCSNSLNNHEYFSQFLKQDQTVVRKVTLEKVSIGSSLFEDETHYIYDYVSKVKSKYPKYPIYPGTKISITEIGEYIVDGRGPQIAAIGYIENPSTKELVKFSYNWSAQNGHLKIAPWEDKSVGTRRNVESTFIHGYCDPYTSRGIVPY